MRNSITRYNWKGKQKSRESYFLLHFNPLFFPRWIFVTNLNTHVFKHKLSYSNCYFLFFRCNSVLLASELLHHIRVFATLNPRVQKLNERPSHNGKQMARQRLSTPRADSKRVPRRVEKRQGSKHNLTGNVGNYLSNVLAVARPWIRLFKTRFCALRTARRQIVYHGQPTKA